MYWNREDEYIKIYIKTVFNRNKHCIETFLANSNPLDVKQFNRNKHCIITTSWRTIETPTYFKLKALQIISNDLNTIEPDEFDKIVVEVEDGGRGWIKPPLYGVL